MKDFKGITDKVTLTIDRDGRQFVCDLKNWQVTNLPDELSFYTSMTFKPVDQLTKGPDGRLPRGVYRGTFTVDKPSDTFLDFSDWGKGLVYVNGHDMGRIWEIGPQQTLYMPGCWLKKGENEIVVFDITGPRSTESEGLKTPIIDKLNIAAPNTHRQQGDTLDLTGNKPVAAGTLAAGNGWQTIKFDTPATGRYLCIEGLNAADAGDVAAIAELYARSTDNKRISRQPWRVIYADSEEINGNHTADKTFDLQESTFWATAKAAPYPHAIVIDLGTDVTLSAIEYLPRMESDSPGAIKDYRIYLSDKPFKLR